MNENTNLKKFVSIGLMSGTSMDGIDAALIITDGFKVIEFGPTKSIGYSDKLKYDLKLIANEYKTTDGKKIELKANAIADHLGKINAKLILDLLKESNLSANKVDVIGYHGQTVIHNPHQHISIQLGNPNIIKEIIGSRVVYNFRKNDILNGGEGAPLTPVYHNVITQSSNSYPQVFLNIGGVSNITYVDKGIDPIAFDTGPGNALIDDYMMKLYAKDYDLSGDIAARGVVNRNFVKNFLSNDYFRLLPPKSLDRNHFVIDVDSSIADDDLIASLTQITIESIGLAKSYFPKKPKIWIVCGGGRNNRTIIRGLQEIIKEPVVIAEEVNLRGKYIEAEAFAFLAVRRILGMPISYPSTTGVRKPVMGGEII